MWYKITPNDTLFFRGGMPFTMGAESWTEIIFPPNPSTLYGAIRTWLIFAKGSLKDFKEGRFKQIYVKEFPVLVLMFQSLTGSIQTFTI